MASKRTHETAASRPDAGNGTAPRRSRIPLRTLHDVSRELGRLYRDGRAGAADVQNVSRLASVLDILRRVLADSELEARVSALESNDEDDTNAS